MTPEYNKVHNRFKLNGIHYTYEDLMEVAYSFVKEGMPYEALIGEFLLDWLDHHEVIKVNTSGSTGKPKRISINKQAMVSSAIATGNFFNLKPGDKALHCLPSNFIAGKMMLIRAVILGLEVDLVAPTLQPDFNTKTYYDFCAMIPAQLQNSLDKSSRIKTIIVGGAPVSSALRHAVQDIPSNVYETYGMTETVTHIAVKKTNNFNSEKEEGLAKASYFQTLPNVRISQDKRDCLVIEAPELLKDKIVTNDIVKCHSETEFEWLGRYDNVINSGGLKLFPETIEAKLQDKIKERYFVASTPHETLGEQLVLVLEGDSNKLNESIFADLDKLEKPKSVFAVKEFVETDSGKIQRKKTLELLDL
ncbi:AMP-binding protein [Flavivirga eckloniae]|uniref:O-succinylbenzoic acid--CoA ligase n=1 Tax=Flavivirga eckloniae TaxID=1803846 RepID=A0A2K9PWN2_9FLAO|nr:AMP-binding protein [Flavivirga eckloniae]AUP81440.1 O-succinylbenzoic acid--CoA ligase [Flavivirga eckloniae]